MSPELNNSTTTAIAEVADKDSYLGDPNRKGATRGEAIFGDKQAQFKALETDQISPEGQDIAEKYNSGDETNTTHEAASHAVALLALHEAAAMGDWDQSRIDSVRKDIEAKV